MALTLLDVLSISVDPNNGNSSKPELTTYFYNNELHQFEEDLPAGTQDFGDTSGLNSTPIDWYWETGYNSNPAGYLYTFAYALLRIALKYLTGTPDTPQTNQVLVEVIPMDDTAAAGSNSINVEDPAKKMYNIPLGDVVAEKVRLSISGSNTVYISKFILWVSERIKVRERP